MMQPLREPGLRALCDVARRAAREVMEVYAGPFQSWAKDDDSPVTQADLRADAAIRQGLAQAFPGVPIVSEESAAGRGERHDTFFLVDPLDGTKEFIARSGEFTVNIALVHEGRATAGVVLAPHLDELFFAAQGLGAWKEAAGAPPLALRCRPAESPLRVVGSRSHGGEQLAAWLARLPGTYRLLQVGSSIKFCRIAEGLADVYPRMGPTCQWDTAAGQAVLEEAGGAVLDGKGVPLRYGWERPMLNPDFIALGDAAASFPPLA